MQYLDGISLVFYIWCSSKKFCRNAHPSKIQESFWPCSFIKIHRTKRHVLVVWQDQVCHTVLHIPTHKEGPAEKSAFPGGKPAWVKYKIKQYGNAKKKKGGGGLLHSYVLIRMLSKKMLKTTLWVGHGAPWLCYSPLDLQPPHPRSALSQLLAARAGGRGKTSPTRGPVAGRSNPSWHPGSHKGRDMKGGCRCQRGAKTEVQLV